jgi:phosphoribosylformylglycinamidine synthase
LATVGAEPVAATNNLNFGNPERPEIMAQLVEAVEGMAEACRFFDTPITGGNVSLYNETLGEGIFPTPVLGIVGLLPTAAPMPLAFQQPGRTVLLIGGLGECEPARFGGTEYAKVVVQQLWGLPPALDLDQEKRVQSAVREIVRASVVESCHDLSDGGLAVALAEASQGGIGAEVHVNSSLRPEFLLFHEGPSRVLVSTADASRVRDIASRHGVDALEIGKTVAGHLRIRNGDVPLCTWTIDELRNAYEGGLGRHV